ncbi:MAG: hypothetical protein H6618_03110 [Deltaproteobacteria bacterium]|nr:hypothetical protein [Deltaproteobacteria bacterium]
MAGFCLWPVSMIAFFFISFQSFAAEFPEGDDICTVKTLPTPEEETDDGNRAVTSSSSCEDGINSSSDNDSLCSICLTSVLERSPLDGVACESCNRSLPEWVRQGLVHPDCEVITLICQHRFHRICLTLYESQVRMSEEIRIFACPCCRGPVCRRRPDSRFICSDSGNILPMTVWSQLPSAIMKPLLLQIKRKANQQDQVLKKRLYSYCDRVFNAEFKKHQNHLRCVILCMHRPHNLSFKDVLGPNVRWLCLSKSELTASDLDELLGAMEENESLTHLDLSGNNIDAGGAEKLAKALEKNKLLTHLDLSGNRIGQKGLRTFREHLKDNAVIQCLDLSDNQICPDIFDKIYDRLHSMASCRGSRALKSVIIL